MSGGLFEGCLTLLRFMLRHCDDDLVKLLHESAPPADVDKVDCFRAAAAKYLKKAWFKEL